MPTITTKSVQPLVFMLLIAFLLIWGSNGQCFGDNCKIALKQNQAQKYTMAQIVQAIDKEIRRVYWYYLQDSIQIFQANFEVPSKDTLHFYIYRNKVGTFLVVISKKKDTIDVSVNTFTRLGSGFTQETPSKTQPIAIDPYIIYLKLSPYELVLQQNGGNKTMREVNTTDQELARKKKLQQQVNKVDEYVRKNYWYYLDKAVLSSFSPLITNQKFYIVLTYINITGTYLITAEIDDKTGIPKINTFLRLGAGSSTGDGKPIVIQPKLLGLGQ